MAAAQPARRVIIAGFEEINASPSSTGVRRSMAKIATFSSASMPCAWTACVRSRIAAPCLSRWTIRACLPGAPTVAASADEAIDIDDLAAELAGVAGADDITVLRHVRTSADKRAAEEIADRKPCEDFEAFKPCSSACNGSQNRYAPVPAHRSGPPCD